MGGLADVPTGIATTSAGSILAPGTTQSVGTTGTYTMPAGCYYVYSAGNKVKFQVFDSDSSGTWHDMTVTGAIPGLIYSDGINMRFSNVSTTGAQNVIFQKIG